MLDDLRHIRSTFLDMDRYADWFRAFSSAGERFLRAGGMIFYSDNAYLSNGMLRVLPLLYYCYSHFERLSLFIRRWFRHRLNSCFADWLFASSKFLHQIALVALVLGLLNCRPVAGSQWLCMIDDINILYWSAAWFDFWGSHSASLLLVGMAIGLRHLPDKLCWLYARYLQIYVKEHLIVRFWIQTS